jgi:polyisoprenoid-binding protein YceI
MTTTLKRRRRTKAAAWKLDRSGVTFELKVKPRHGPITFAGAFSRIEATLQIDADGRLTIRSLIDASSVRYRRGEDPRLDMHLRRALDSSRPLILFETEQMSEPASGAGRFHVGGHLRIGAGAPPVPVQLDATVSRTGNSLRFVGRIPVDHRRLGLAWLPSGPLKAPTEVVVHARLVPAAGREDDIRVLEGSDLGPRVHRGAQRDAAATRRRFRRPTVRRRRAPQVT